MVAVHFPPPREVELVTERVTAGVDSNSPFSVAAASIEFFEPQTPVWSAEDNGELSSQWDSICSPMQVSHPRVSASSVKQRAQFFEALIKSNTDTVIRVGFSLAITLILSLRICFLWEVLFPFESSTIAITLLHCAVCLHRGWWTGKQLSSPGNQFNLWRKSGKFIFDIHPTWYIPYRREALWTFFIAQYLHCLKS